MSDDIVTRLRKCVLDGADVYGRTQLAWDIQEAADEIECLRAEVADWQRTVRAIEPDYFF